MNHKFEIDNSNNEYNLEININDKGYDLIKDVTSVWYRRPLIPKVSSSLKTSQAKKFAEDEAYYYLKCLWQMLSGCIWVSYPWAISWANVKLHQLQIAKRIGFKIPRTLVTNNPADIFDFYRDCKERIIVKPFHANVVEYGNKTPVIYTSMVRKNDFQRLNDVKYTLHFFQEEIKKEADIRVIVVGDYVFCASLNSQLDSNIKLDWRRSTSKTKKWQLHKIPIHLEKKCIAFVKEYDLNFGAFDFALAPSGEYIFFELNPNGQWVWLEVELKLPITDALIKLLTKENK